MLTHQYPCQSNPRVNPVKVMMNAAIAGDHKLLKKIDYMLELLKLVKYSMSN